MYKIGNWKFISGKRTVLQGILLGDGRHYTLRTVDKLNGVDPDREVLMVFGGYAYFGFTDGKIDSKGLLHLINKKYHIDDRHGMANFEGWQYVDEVLFGTYESIIPFKNKKIYLSGPIIG